MDMKEVGCNARDWIDLSLAYIGSNGWLNLCKDGNEPSSSLKAN